MKKIAVGISGGVDSAVSALLLKQQGYEVIGINLLLYKKPDEIESSKDLKDAQAICDKIGIDFFVKDLRDEFMGEIIDNFVGEYQNGRTPNPCIMCNEKMKFGKLLDYATELGCDYLATGHYAKIEEKDGHFYLKRTDNPKDQSYFLYRLKEEKLARIKFPLFNMEKPQIREIAKQNNLPVALKSDSQDICFVKDGDYISFIEKYANQKAIKGSFVDEKGEYLGEHKGIYCYTVGQRRGLGIALGERCFVSKIDANENKVYLSTANSKKPKKFLIENVTFINIQKLEGTMDVTAKTRYRQKPENATITAHGNDIILEYHDYESFVSPGQSAVFYIDDTVIGGGLVKSILN